MIDIMLFMLGLLVVVVVIGGLGVLIYLGIRKLMSNGNSTDSNANPGADDSRLKTFTESLTARSLVIGVLALLMLIPLSMVDGMVSERHSLYRSVLSDIASTWGRQQVLKGPALVVPYVERYVVEETVTDEKTGEETTTSKVVFRNSSAIVLPEDLKIAVDIGEQYRHRGIYDSLVYTAELKLQGRFKQPDIASLTENLYRTDWDKAYLVLSLSDTRAINEVSSLNWNGEPKGLAPGTKLPEMLGNGFHAPLGKLNPDSQHHDFKLQLSVNGSQGFRFAPFGENTEVHMTSSWPHPSFQGSVLPASYDTHDDGFEAKWSIPHLARNYPQLWAYPAKKYDLDEFVTGVNLFEPVFLYSKVTRAVKYGLLFVGLTFLTFLIFELTSPVRLHFVQYGLIGIALSLFYLTLLSVAEHTSFLRAYVLGSGINIGLITLYTGAAMRSWGRAIVVLTLLATLYVLLYSLLQLEDYALLMGTALLMVVVAVLMYLTRNLRAGQNV